MEHNENSESPEDPPKRPVGPQARPRARSAARREDIAPADAGAENKKLSEDIAPAEAGAQNKHSTPNPLIPTFTPVPRLKDRSNGWKPHIQQRFIEALAETGSVAAACKRVGRTDHGAYLLRRHPEAGEFRAAWDAALDLGVRRIEDHAMDRALYGAEEVVVQNGETIVKRRRYNERLVMFLLRNRAPERFTEGRALALSAMDKTRLKQLKQKWWREWDAQRRAAEPDIEEVRRDMLRKVNTIKHAERQRWTQREWRLYGAWQRERLARRRREKEEYHLSHIARQNDHVRPRMEAAYRAAKERGDFDRDEPLSLPEILGDEELG